MARVLLLILLAVVAIRSEAAVKRIEAVEIDRPPRIDGVLDDECWKKAAKVDDFIQEEPEKGAPPTERTVVYLAFDRRNLYIAFECFTSNAEKLQASATRHDDEFFNDDHVEVMIDTFRDKRNAYIFSVNLLSTKAEWRYAGGRRERFGGKSWDCEWHARAKKYDDRWVAEIAIPFSELRFRKEKSAVWGINFLRNDEQHEEEDIWSLPGESSHDPAYYGELVGLPTEKLVTIRPLEFKPYLTANRRIEEGRLGADVGLDVRVPLPSVTIDVTLNPDYAQIEADPERINLSDIPIRFPEKRPFFMEGEELFRTPLDVFYTRKIVQPLLGVKAVGKLGGYSFAVFDTLTEEMEEEPSANFLVMRLTRDVGERSTIGLLAVDKEDKEGGNRVGGIDFNLKLPLDTGLIGLSGQMAFSHTSRESEKSDLGFTVRGGWEREPFGAHVSYQRIGEDFTAEAGFLPDVFIGREGWSASFGFHKPLKSRVLRRIGFGGEYRRGRTLEGVKTYDGWDVGMGIGLWDTFTRVGFTKEFRTDPKDVEIGYNDWSVGGFAGWFPPKYLLLMSEFRVGTRDEKGIVFLTPTLILRPLQTTSLKIETQLLWREEGEDQRIIRTVLEHRFTPEMRARFTFENTSEGRRSAFFLYSWEFKPESNLFLVYTYNRSAKDETEQIGYFKIAYRMRWQP